MGRRIRHMNPAHHDAIRNGTCLDARFISGVASGAALQTWNSRPGGAHTYTQATSARRPIYIVAALGGQPVVQFALADTHWMSRSGIAVTSTMNPYTVMGAMGAASAFAYTQTSDTSFLGARSSNWTLAVRDANRLEIINTATTGVAVPAASPITGALSVGRNSATTLYSLTTPTGARATVTAATLALSTARNATTPSTYGDTAIAALCIATAAISDAMRNRVMHHYGFSFKRAL